MRYPFALCSLTFDGKMSDLVRHAFMCGELHLDNLTRTSTAHPCCVKVNSIHLCCLAITLEKLNDGLPLLYESIAYVMTQLSS